MTSNRQLIVVLMNENDPDHQKRFEYCCNTAAGCLNEKIRARTVRDKRYHPGDLYFFDCCGREDTWREEIAALEIPRSSLILISEEKDRWRDVLHCGGYDLVRPGCMLEDMCCILGRYLNEHAGCLYLPFHKTVIQIPLASISSISVLGNRIAINTTGGTYTRHVSLNAFIIENDLLQEMVRINRSELVNPQFVQDMHADSVKMKDGNTLYFSRSRRFSARVLLYRTHLKNRFSDHSN